MISVRDAFLKFRTKLELTQGEQDDASRRQQEIRDIMDKSFALDDDFLTGSYRRWTKTKPLKDVDIFCVLATSERHYRNKQPSILLADVKKALALEYGDDHVSTDEHSVTVDFGIEEDENGETGERVMSFDLVPAFTCEDYYEIPDDSASASNWMKTNPKVHYDKALNAQKAYSDQWKFLVRMAKAWNRNHDKLINPSFLIEVMALEVLYPPFGGDYRREMQAFFQCLADRIYEDWADPAGLGPDVNRNIDRRARDVARDALLEAQRQASAAIRLESAEKNGDALRAWRSIFGKTFPLS